MRAHGHARSTAVLLAVIACGCLTACVRPAPGPTAPPPVPTTTPTATPPATTSPAAWPATIGGLERPTNLVAPDDGSGRLFVTEQDGVIRVIRDGAVLKAPALDIRDRVGTSGNERGLLGLAFPPDFATKGRAYIYFTDDAGTSRFYRVRISSSDPDVFDPATMQLILSVKQPFANHNGGQLAFGPDGHLYIGLGDGGGGGDPGNRARDLATLLGKILRIDVESAPDTPGYRVPADNPFANRAGARPEIWAYGLRNPWRFSFDPLTGDLWIGDVGQNKWEEIDRVAGGGRGGQDFGWSLYEGNKLYKARSRRTGVVWPVFAYGRTKGGSVTGGYVYRGTAHPGMQGMYVFGDYVSGNIWTLRPDGSRWTPRVALATSWGISTFGVDGAGELWAADHIAGKIHRVGDLSR